LQPVPETSGRLPILRPLIRRPLAATYHESRNTSLGQQDYQNENRCAFCRHAFELTFVENAHDIYGKDIDLTSRLLGFAGAREIVMNAGFVERVQEIYSRLSGKEEYPEVEKIFGPLPQAIKGFKEHIAIFKVPAPHWA
jgi:hypothetical protein